jgi:hypothetical protein
LHPPAELQKTDVEWIIAIPPLPVISNDTYDAHDESHDVLDLHGIEGKLQL